MEKPWPSISNADDRILRRFSSSGWGRATPSQACSIAKIVDGGRGVPSCKGHRWTRHGEFRAIMRVSRTASTEDVTPTATTIRKAVPLNAQKRLVASRVSVSCRPNRYTKMLCSKSRLGSSMGRANVRDADASWCILIASGSYAGRDVSTENGIRK